MSDNDIDTSKFMKSMMGIMMLAIIGSLVVTMTTQAPGTYCCPLCTECFHSMADLEAHFESAHPSSPINIIWD